MKMTENMKSIRIFTLAVMSLCTGVLQAQNYNPTVVVTNKYKVETESIRKGEVEMAVPDSVRTFNMTFDYSIFDTPYRGAYEFSPYSVDMRPSFGERRPGMFYMNAGIGYTLHPELDLVYTPFSNGRLSLDIYGNHHSFAGDYRRVGLDDNGKLTGLKEDGKRLYWGNWNYDMDNEAGVSFRYDWDRVGLTADLGYDGMQQRDWMRRRSLDKASALVRVFSKDTLSGGVGFSTYVKYGFGHDRMVPKYGAERVSVGENAFDAGVSLGVRTRKAGRFLLDMDASVASYMLGLGHTSSIFSFTPHYLLNVKGWSFDLGVRADIPVNSKNAGYENDAKSQYAYPVVKISYDFQKVPLNIYLAVTGGEKMNSYTSLMESYRHYGLSSALLAGNHAVLGNSVERVKASFGLKGRIRSVFGYEAFVSYAERATSPLECVRLSSVDFGGGMETVPMYDLTFASSGLLTAGLDARYSDDWGRVELGLRYNGLFTRGEVPYYVAPAALTGNAAVQFNIIRRIFVGVGCEFSTVRRGVLADASGSPADFRIPGFGEPYFNVEFQYSRMLSVWLKGSRLTGQTIQRTPLYAERGPELTAGVRLSFGK